METTETGLRVLTRISDVVQIHKPIIDDKVAKAKAACSAVKIVSDDKTDEYVNNLLVKVGKTETEIEGLRKAYTGPINDWLKEQIAPENELKAESERLRGLRKAYAMEKAKAAADEKAKIALLERFKTHEAEVKSRMKVSVEDGVARKLQELETAIAGLFEKATAQTVDQLEKSLNIKPGLKEEFFNGLLTVPYDAKIMSSAQFKELQERARGYWKFENINKEYQETANKILADWRLAIPGRKKELVEIAKGGAEAEKLKAQAQARAQAEAEARAKAEAERKAELDRKAQEEANEGALSASFEAQVAAQEIKELEGVRKKKIFMLDARIERDPVKIVKALGSIMLHVLTEPRTSVTDEGKVGVWKRDKGGNVVFKEEGVPLYLEGIQFWLDELAKLKSLKKVEIEGIIETDSLTVVTQSKGKKTA
jgi:hypothetical protein